MNRMEAPASQRVVRLGGISLIAGAVAFMAVFSYLAAKFNYPAVLSGAAAEVLPALLATGARGRFVWAVYSLLPLLWIPAAVGARQALGRQSEGRMQLAMILASIASFSMVLGLMRWPSLQWTLAEKWMVDPSARPALTALFDAANAYLGNYIGEFLGELAVNCFFILAASAMLERGSGFPVWIGWIGVASGAIGLVAMFRNVTTAVDAIAAFNNYLLPVWMILFGISLWRYAASPFMRPMLAAGYRPAES